MEDSVSRRNAESFKSAIEDLYKKQYESKELIRSLQESNSALITRMNSLEQLLNIQKVLMTGTGPSVRT